jgi:hypothetical protein
MYIRMFANRMVNATNSFINYSGSNRCIGNATSLWWHQNSILEMIAMCVI